MARPGSGLLVPVNGLGYPPQNLARVVVWEWMNEHGRWRPYSAAVCHHIENVLKGDARGTVVLGQVDGQLSPYIIDLQSMHQFRQDTGKQHNGFLPVCTNDTDGGVPELQMWTTSEHKLSVHLMMFTGVI